MSTSATAREARQQRRFEELTSTDAQLVAAQPDPAITAAIGAPGQLVADVIRTVMDGYADRPALGQRAVEFATDANGRTVAALQPRFDTLTYRETWARVRALAEALADNPVSRASVATRILQRRLRNRGHGAVADRSDRGSTCRPMPRCNRLHPIFVGTEPVAIISSVDHLQDAVELALPPTPEAAGGFRLPPAGRRPPRGAGIRRSAPRQARRPGRSGQ